MVGLIQKLFFDMLRASANEEVILQIKEIAGIPANKEFHMNEVYSDEEWQRILAAALKVLNITPEKADELYADYFLQDAIDRFPIWFKMSKNAYAFLSMQPTIHNCFATSVLDDQSRQAINDKFRVDQFPNKIVTHYNSPNHHCGLYKALASSVLKYYKEEANIRETQCIKNGAKNCEIHIEWAQ